MTPGGIDPVALADDLETLASFGATADGAVTRTAYSEADLRARDWVDARCAELGMSVRRDRAGNSVALLPGREPGLRPLAVGSHTDTVPEGGRYDGALGVLAGLACVRALRRGGAGLRHPLIVVNFQAEEATMAGATFGSRAFAGALDPATIDRPAFDGATVRRHLERVGLDPDRVTEAAGEREPLAAFLELHVEQGPVLDEAGVPIGLVEGIAGIRRHAATFRGTANHAGTTPMAARDDALVSAAPFIVAVRDVAVAHDVVATVGALRVRPGAPNVIPGRVELDLELRSPDDARLAGAEDELGRRAAAAGGELRRLSAKPPQPFSAELVDGLERVSGRLGLPCRRLWSWAGHDAGVLAAVTDAAMLFVPSRGGVSHSVRELTAHEDCVAGATVLLHAIAELDARD